MPLRTIPGTSLVYGDGLLEGGVVDSSGTHVAGQQRNYATPNSNRSCVRGYDVSQEDIAYRNETVIFGGILVSHFGHMLYDTTSRLWYPASQDTITKIVFVLFPGQEFPYFSLLEMAGIGRDRIEIVREPTRFAQVIIPDETVWSGSVCRCKREWMRFFDAVRANTSASEHRKVYFTRTAYSIQNCIGEDYFEEFYRANGYEVVSPEKLPLSEQVAIAAGAESLVSTGGTIAGLVLFSRPGTQFTILNRSREVVDGTLMATCARKAKVTLVDIYRSFLPEVQGGNCIYLLYPTECWESYLHEAGFSASVKPMPFEEVLYEYVMKWAAFVENPSRYRWIKNHSLASIAWRANRYLRGIAVDAEEYPASNRETLQTEGIVRLRCENGFLKGKHALAHVSATNATEIELKGELHRGAWFTREESGAQQKQGIQLQAGAYTAPAQIEGEKNGILHWRARFSLVDALQALSAESVPSDTPIYLCVSGKDGSALTFRIAHYAEEKLPECLDERLVLGQSLFRLDRDPDSLLLLLLLALNKPNSPYQKATYKIEEMKRDGSELSFAGWVESPLFQLLEIEASIAFRRYQKEDELGLSIPLELCADAQRKGCRHWKVAVSQSEVESLSRKEHIRWDMYLELSSEAASRRIRIGKQRPKGSFKVFSSRVEYSADASCYVRPLETGKKNLSFETGDLAIYSDRIAKCTLSQLSWEVDTLVLSGSLSCALACDALAPRLILMDPNSKRPLDIHWNFTNKEDEKQATWECRIGSDQWMALGQAEATRFELGLACILGEREVFIPIGAHRPSGSVETFRSHMPCVGGVRIVPFEARRKNLAFLALGAAPFPDGANAVLDDESRCALAFLTSRIHEVQWDSETLVLRGNTQSPLFQHIDGDALTFSLVNASSATALRVPATVIKRVNQSEMRWEISFTSRFFKKQRRIFKSARGIWELRCSLSFNGLDADLPFGRQRPKGSFDTLKQAQFAFAHGLTAQLNQRHDKNLIFEVKNENNIPNGGGRP